MRLSNLWMRDRKFMEKWEHAHRWNDLSTYNSEVARGLVHTPEWTTRMVKRQAAFDAEMHAKYANDPNTIIIGDPE